MNTWSGRTSGVSMCSMLMIVAGCAPEIKSPLSARGMEGRPFSYTIEATNSPTVFAASVPPPNGISIDPMSGVISGTPSESGVFATRIRAANSHGEDMKSLEINIGHAVASEKELLIVDHKVVQGARAQRGGSWHFRSAVERIVGPGANVDDFAEAWFSLWAAPQDVGSQGQFKVPAMPDIATAIRNAWRNDGIKLLAIVNRIDLTSFVDNDEAKGVRSLGEGRFVYEVQGASFTLILEYGLPVRSGETPTQALTRWANSWHALGASSLSPDAYGTALEAITSEYSAHGNLRQARTNHIGSIDWNLREFHFRAGSPGRMVQAVTAQSPDSSHLGSAAMGTFINANQRDILAGTFALPPEFLGGMSKANEVVRPAGVMENARFVVSFNTCIGCHTGTETSINPFQHIRTFRPGVNADLSNFMTGAVQSKTPGNKFPGEGETHNEMSGRVKFLGHFAGVGAGGRAGPDQAKQERDEVQSVIKNRAMRVH